MITTPQVADRFGDPTAVVRTQGDPQVQRVRQRTGLLGEQLRVVERVVEGVQGINRGVGGPDQVAAGLDGIQSVVIHVTRHEHVGAAELVDRRPPGRVGAQGKRLVLPQLGMQAGGYPADRPAPLIAGHLQLAVIGPRPILGKVPGEAVDDGARVLGILRAEDLRVQVGRLQTRPRGVERFPGFVGVVAELGRGRGIANGERGEESRGSRPRALGAGRAAWQRHAADQQKGCAS